GREPASGRQRGQGAGAHGAGDRRAHRRGAARGWRRGRGDRAPARRRRHRASAGALLMADAPLMDRMFHRIMRGLIDTGTAPHYAELARALGLSPDAGRQLLHDVMQAYPIGWLHPETDYIASFPPLNNLPTQYRVIVLGAHGCV